MSESKKNGGMPGWLVLGVIVALAAAVVGFATRNAKGNKRYSQLVGAIDDLIQEGRAKAEDAVDVLTETGDDLAKDLKRGMKKAKHRLG
ncbi:hypothetical protein [Microlunatus speluncae]|uniref:hypothetical protein n=1 Tax=Microlunatus speluncae TaxID=2594267 RepID=UPI00126619F7|nr:hypothetical protein [Microlunatus speluncae]